MSIKTFTGTGTTGASVTATSSPGTALDVVGTGATYTTIGGRNCITNTVSSTYGWATTSNTVLLRWKFYATSAITVDTFLAFVVYNVSTQSGRAYINSASHLRLSTAGSGTSTTRWTDTNTLVGSWMRAEMLLTAGTSTTTGSVRLALYNDDSTTPIGDSTTISGIDTAGTLAAFVGGRFYTVSTVATRDWGMKDGVDAVWGAWPANTAPSITMPDALVITNGDAWSLTPVVADDGSGLNVLWSVSRTTTTGITVLSTGLTGTTTATLHGDASTTSIAGSVLTATITATDDGGLISSDSTEILIPVVPTSGTATLRPLAFDPIVTGTWTRAGSATSDGAALADELSNTYIESGATSVTPQSHRHRLQPCPTGLTAITATDSVLTDTGTCTGVEKLYEGTTLRATGNNTTVTTTATNVSVTLPDASTIVDPSVLWAETVVTS